MRVVFPFLMKINHSLKIILKTLFTVDILKLRPEAEMGA